MITVPIVKHVGGSCGAMNKEDGVIKVEDILPNSFKVEVIVVFPTV